MARRARKPTTKEQLQNIANSFNQPEKIRTQAKAYLERLDEIPAGMWHITLSPEYKFIYATEPIKYTLEDMPYIDNKTVGSNLKIRREFFNMTQQEVGDAIGCSRQAYQKYEAGARSLPIDLLVKLTKLFKSNIEQIVFPPRSLCDTPLYRPHAKISNQIHLAEVRYYYEDVASIRREIDATHPITYSSLYNLLEKKRQYAPIGFTTAEKGEQILLLSQVMFPKDKEILDKLNQEELEDSTTIRSLPPDAKLDPYKVGGGFPQIIRFTMPPMQTLLKEIELFFNNVQN